MVSILPVGGDRNCVMYQRIEKATFCIAKIWKIVKHFVKHNPHISEEWYDMIDYVNTYLSDVILFLDHYYHKHNQWCHDSQQSSHVESLQH